MASPFAGLVGHKYISLATFRKSGQPVRTPVWFAEVDGKLYFFTNPMSGKAKRIRNNPNVRLAPSTFRGRILGPDIPARARLVPRGEDAAARAAVRKKYWLARVPFLWRKSSVYVELAPTE